MPESVIEKHELHAQLWMDYFRPKEPLNKSDRRLLRERMNSVAKAANTQQNHASLQVITESTQWQPTPDAEAAVVAKKNGAKPKAQSTESKPKTGTNKPAQLNSSAGVPASGKIKEIIDLHLQGFSKKDIIAKGYNKSTVNRQVGEYIKRTGGKNES